MDFNPQRFKIARMRRGVGTYEIAQRLGLRHPLVVAYAKGKCTPDAMTAERLGEILRFPAAFFYGPDLPEVPANAF